MRHELAIAVLLLCASCAWAQDPAYVDALANRAMPDPARADGGGDRSAAAFSATGPEPQMDGGVSAEAAQRETLAEIERMAAAHAEAAYRGQQQGLAAARADQRDAPYADPPIGGRNLLDDVRRDSGHGDGFGPAWSRTAMPQPATAPAPGTAMRQQIGPALMQDAAGVIDARVRQEIYGSSGPVYLPGDAYGD